MRIIGWRHGARHPETWDDMGVFCRLVTAALGTALEIVVRPWSQGVRNVPGRGRVILASSYLPFSGHSPGPLPVPRKVVLLTRGGRFPGRELWPSLRIRPRARVGVPAGLYRYRGRESDGHLLRAVTDEIMQGIAKLSGQEYVDVAARRAKAALARGDGDHRRGGLG
jgi:hypothetical protein